MTQNKVLLNKQKSRRKRKIECQSPLSRIGMGATKALLISISSAFLFILISTMITLKLRDPSNAARPMGISCLILASLLCGYFMKKFSMTSVICSGAAAAFVLSVFVFTASLLIKVPTDTFSPGMRAPLLLLILISSTSGAALGNVRFVKRRRPRHRCLK